MPLLSAIVITFTLGMATNLVLARAERAREPRQPANEDVAGATQLEVEQSVPTAGLGTACAVAAWYNPVFALPSVLLTGYLAVPFWRAAWRDYTTHGRVLAFFDGVLISILVLARQFFTAALLILLSLLVRVVLGRAFDLLRQLAIDPFGTLPRRVWLERDGIEIELDSRQVRPGDIVVVAAGEICPVDGTVIGGQGVVDQRLHTGDPTPVESAPGHRVSALSRVVSGRLRIKAVGAPPSGAGLTWPAPTPPHPAFSGQIP